LNNFLFSRKPLLARVSELSSRARAKKQEKNKKKPKKNLKKLDMYLIRGATRR